MGAALQLLDRIDKGVSGIFHRMESKILEFLLLPSGIIHNGNIGFAFLISLLVFFIIPREAELSDRKLLYGEALGYGLAYLAHGPPMLILTKGLKKIFGRDRPVAPKPGAANRRTVNLRGLENNHSFPSGDSAQAANWMCFMYLYTPNVI